MASRVVYSQAGKALWVIVTTPETAPVGTRLRILGTELRCGETGFAFTGEQTGHLVSAGREKKQAWTRNHNSAALNRRRELPPRLCPPFPTVLPKEKLALPVSGCVAGFSRNRT